MKKIIFLIVGVLVGASAAYATGDMALPAPDANRKALLKQLKANGQLKEFKKLEEAYRMDTGFVMFWMRVFGLQSSQTPVLPAAFGLTETDKIVQVRVWPKCDELVSRQEFEQSQEKFQPFPAVSFRENNDSYMEIETAEGVYKHWQRGKSEIYQDRPTESFVCKYQALSGDKPAFFVEPKENTHAIDFADHARYFELYHGAQEQLEASAAEEERLSLREQGELILKEIKNFLHIQ